MPAVPVCPGEWFAVPLPAGGFGAGIAVAAEPKRVAAYFFACPDPGVPSLDRLALRAPREAVWRTWCSDRALFHHRWPRLGVPPGFDAERWPVPPRGAEIASAARVEDVLARRDVLRPRACVRDLRSPVRPSHLAVPDGARAIVQWRGALAPAELQAVAQTAAARPAHTAIRLYGAAAAQAGEIAAWAPASLALDARALPSHLPAFAGVRELELTGVPDGGLAPLLRAFPNLRSLRVAAPAGEIGVREFAGASQLNALAIAGAAVKPSAVGATLPHLRVLELRDVRVCGERALDELLERAPLRALRLCRVTPLRSLAPLAGLRALDVLALQDLTAVDDLAPLHALQALRSLDVRGMWQLGVPDLGFVLDLPHLERLHVDIGGRRKNVELYKRRTLALPRPFRELLVQHVV